MEKFHSKIKNVGTNSKMVLIPYQIIQALKWEEGTQVVVYIKKEVKNERGVN